MIKFIGDIVETDFQKVDILDSVRKVVDYSAITSQKCFPVYDNDIFAGVVTYNELIKAHPNRIIADVMCLTYYVLYLTHSIWHAKEIFDNNNNIDTILVMKDNEVIGMVDKAMLYIEIGKCIDILTGLCKSSFLYYKAEELLGRGNEISIIFIDVNNFGQIDKKYGHMVGDVILNEISRLLSQNVPDDAYLCRYGGDEFAILTCYSVNECEKLAARLQSLVLSNTYTGDIKVGIAVGIASSNSIDKQTDNQSDNQEDKRLCCSNDIIHRLVNVASIASTKAKCYDENLQHL